MKKQKVDSSLEIIISSSINNDNIKIVNNSISDNKYMNSLKNNNNHNNSTNNSTDNNNDNNINTILFFKIFRNKYIKAILFQQIKLLNSLNVLISNQEYSNFYSHNFKYQEYIQKYNLYSYNSNINIIDENSPPLSHQQHFNQQLQQQQQQQQQQQHSSTNNNCNNSNNISNNIINSYKEKKTIEFINRIEKKSLPNNIKYLTITLNDEPNIEENSIPESVETIKFQSKFVGVLNSYLLPKNLKKLIFNLGCSSMFNSNSFSNFTSLEVLVLSGRFNYQIPVGVLPSSSLKEIHFTGKYNLPLLAGSMPDSLRIMVFGDDYNQQFELNTIPSNVEYMSFGKKFNVELTSDWVPSSLKELKLSEGFNKFIKPGVLPTTLERFEYNDSSNQNEYYNSQDEEYNSCYYIISPFEKLLGIGSISNSNCLVLLNGLAIQGPPIDTSCSSANYNFEEKELYFNFRELKPGMVSLYSNIKRIVFHDKFNSLIRKNLLPPTLEEIVFGNSFNKQLVFDAFPSSVKSIIFGDSFDSPFRDARSLPSNLEILEVGARFNQPLLHLPASLKKLKLNYRFDQDIKEGLLPDSLEYLEFGYSYNRPLPVLPQSLKTLILGWCYNQPLAKLPNGLTRLEVGYSFDQSLIVNDEYIIPDSVKELKIRNISSNQLSKDLSNMPKSISKLEINTSPLFVPFNLDKKIKKFKYLGSLKDLPVNSHDCNLKKLYLSQNFNDIIPVGVLPPIKILIMSHKFNQILQPGSLPSSLEAISFGFYYNQATRLNNGIKYIEFGEKFDCYLKEGDIPISTKVLVLDKSYRRPISSNVLVNTNLELIVLKNFNNIPFNIEIFDELILKQIKIITIQNNGSNQSILKSTKKIWKN